MKIKTLLIVSLLFGLWAGSANAQNTQPLLSEDFESGSTDWTTDPDAYGEIVIADPEDPDFNPDFVINHTEKGGLCSYKISSDEYYSYLISPALEEGTENGITFSFWYTNFFLGCASSFRVGYSLDTDDIEDFTWGELIPANKGKVEEGGEENGWERFVGDYPANTVYVAIAFPSEQLAGLLYVDDIFVYPAACASPASLAADATQTSVSLSWVGTSSSYDLQYAPYKVYDFQSGLAPWTPIGLQSQKTEAWSCYDVGSTGNYCAKSSYDSESTDTHYLVSPKVPLGGSISFFAKAESDYDKSEEAGFLFDVLVLASNDDQINPYEIVNAVPICEVQMVNSDGWSYYPLDLTYTGFSGGDGFVIIRHINDVDAEETEYFFPLLIDDVTIREPWQTVDNIETQSYTMENLPAGTNYAIQLRGDCGDDGQSSWTALNVMTIPPMVFVNDGDWNVPNNWKNGIIPQNESDIVLIEAHATIPAGYVAKGTITIADGCSITIADGGQLKIANQVKGTIQKSITNYEGYTGEGNGGYYLLASPTDGQISSFTNFQASNIANIDWYEFNQAGDTHGNEWINKKVASGDTYMIPGQAEMHRGEGYLYARKEDVTLGFVSGVIWNNSTNTSTQCYLEPTNVPYTVPANELDYTSGADWAGWNLVGNPFTCDAYLNRTYFRMNEARDAIVEGDGAIKPCEGVFVVVTAENKVVTFSDTPANTTQSLSLNLNGNNGLMDRVSLHFDGSNNIKKFVLNENATKLYIQQGTTDYAVVSSNGEGEMPVSFKASKNGTYTLSINTENVDVNYLHLIDNKTGADVDLLATPSYSFEARTTDYASRFRLVFNANNGSNENGNETFAYYNGSEWMINNMGDATLQVVDVMGRVLSTEAVSGNATINLNQMPGVYMLRLVSGDSVKVQKVVVR